MQQSLSLRARGRPPKLSPSDTEVIVHNPDKLKAKDLAEKFKVSTAYIYQVRTRFKKGEPVKPDLLTIEEPMEQHMISV